MAMGVVRQSVLCDIGDAIRARNGSNTLYRPSEMAAAIRALDGTATTAGAVEPRKEPTWGLLDGSVLTAIADAIRAQNGSDTRYKPGEMADAIMGLEWPETGADPAARALLLESGTLELTYLATAASPSGGTVAQELAVPTEALTEMGQAPWYASRESVTAVRFDASFAERTTASLAYWFDNMLELESVEGLGNVTGCESLCAAFGHDTKLATVDLAGMDMTGLADVSSAFVGDTALTTIWMGEGQAVPAGAKAGSCFNLCSKLVGGNGTAYKATMTSGTYLRPDVEGTEGYGTIRA